MPKQLETEMTEKMFYLRSRHGDCGTNLLFHNKDGVGHGTNLDGLHLFTAAEAQKHLDHDVRSLPLLQREVDALSVRHVDCQYLDSEFAALNVRAKYVIQVEKVWDGNDICFKAHCGRTFDYDAAEEYTYDEALRIASRTGGYVIWSKEYLNTIARRTFQSENINIRKMITGAGIKYKKPRAKKPDSGKTRHNCPCCGRIVWDFNPYDAPHCSTECRAWYA